MFVLFLISQKCHATFKLPFKELSAIRSKMLDQMRVHSFFNFCYGSHYDALFHNIDRTFCDCHPAVLMLARCIAAQNLFLKSNPRPHGIVVHPEMHSRVCIGSDEDGATLHVMPHRHFTNDAVSLAASAVVGILVPTRVIPPT